MKLFIDEGVDDYLPYCPGVTDDVRNTNTKTTWSTHTGTCLVMGDLEAADSSLYHSEPAPSNNQASLLILC